MSYEYSAFAAGVPLPSVALHRRAHAGVVATRFLCLFFCASGLGASPVAAEKILTFGDSITYGVDDERYPNDSCNGVPVTRVSSFVGFRGLLECRLGQNGENGYFWSHYTQGGITTAWGAVRIDEAIATLPDGDTALFALHTNDCGAECGRVCAGGEANGQACVSDVDCPGAGAMCDTSGQHPCSSAESRANIRTVIDSLLVAGYGRVLFWKTPGRVGALEIDEQYGPGCATAQFDGTADAIDTLFLSDVQPVGYADDPRVEFVDETFRKFCVGSGLQGCDDGDGNGDRRTWWFAHDGGSHASQEGSPHIHPNAWGYMELAATLGQWLTGSPLNARPAPPQVALFDRTPTTLTISLAPGEDSDGDPVTAYMWASCADPGAAEFDAACSAAMPRECGAVSGADHDGLGAGETTNPYYPERHAVVSSGGMLTLTGLAPGVDYRVCAVTYDGFQGSYFNDVLVAAPGLPLPAAPILLRLFGAVLLLVAADRLSRKRTRGESL